MGNLSVLTEVSFLGLWFVPVFTQADSSYTLTGMYSNPSRSTVNTNIIFHSIWPKLLRIYLQNLKAHSEQAEGT